MEASTSLETPAPQFTITRQDHTQYFDQQGNSASRWQIYFTTPSGVESFVMVDDKDYEPEFVAKAIVARVQKIEQIQTLGTDNAQSVA